LLALRSLIYLITDIIEKEVSKCRKFLLCIAELTILKLANITSEPAGLTTLELANITSEPAHYVSESAHTSCWGGLLLVHFQQAKQILFDTSKKATGIIIETEGLSYILSASNEVILSAGVFNSPQLLMASGVGPANTLKGLNIPVVADRPAVGQGMQDHLWYDISYRVNGVTLSALAHSATFAAEQAQLYNDHAASLYSSSDTDVIAWEKIPSFFGEIGATKSEPLWLPSPPIGQRLNTYPFRHTWETCSNPNPPVLMMASTTPPWQPHWWHPDREEISPSHRSTLMLPQPLTSTTWPNNPTST